MNNHQVLPSEEVSGHLGPLDQLQHPLTSEITEQNLGQMYAVINLLSKELRKVLTDQLGPVVQKLISANPGLNF